VPDGRAHAFDVGRHGRDRDVVAVLVADGNSIAVSSAVSINELNHLVGSKASIQTQLDTLSNNVRIVASAAAGGSNASVLPQLDGKQPLVTGAAAAVTEYKLFPHAVLVSDANGDIAHSPTTATELSYVRGVTSAVQTQLNGKQPLATGAATTFLNSNAGANLAVTTNAAGKLSTVAGQATAYSYYGQTGGSAIAPAYSFLGYSNTGVFAPTTASLAFSANGLERARFTSNGFFGVGVTAPTAPLHVGLGPSASTSTSAYFNGGTGSALLTSQNYSSAISITSDSSVWVKNGWSFIASSDRRIKKDIALADLSNVSGIFDSIDLHTYGYIDDAYAQSNQPTGVHGFIAQQVVDVFPEAITITTETIPDIFSMATMSIDSTSTTPSIDSTSTTLSFSFDSPFSLSAGVVAGDRLTC